MPQSYSEAAKRYRKAEENGYEYSQKVLGNFYEQRLGVAKNEQEALKWYYKSAMQGFSPGQNELGVCFIKGTGTSKNYEE